MRQRGGKLKELNLIHLHFDHMQMQCADQESVEAGSKESSNATVSLKRGRRIAAIAIPHTCASNHPAHFLIKCN